MIGPHDLGGRAGFGPIAPEPDEPVFHADWEKRALGMTLCSGALGHWTLDESRHARESLHPAEYYGSSYYEIWIRALEHLLERHREIGDDELDAGKALHPGRAPDRKLPVDRVQAVLRAGGPVERPAPAPPRFAEGDRIRTRLTNPAGHTRLPDYARDKPGVVLAHRGCHVLPDSNAHGRGETPEHLYSIEFRACDLWGESADPHQTVILDAWESYFGPA